MTNSEVGKTALGVLAALLLAFSFPAEAQRTGKVARIGYLAVNSPSLDKQLIEAFQQGLRGLGWVDGQNLIQQWRVAPATAVCTPSQNLCRSIGCAVCVTLTQISFPPCRAWGNQQ